MILFLKILKTINIRFLIYLMKRTSLASFTFVVVIFSIPISIFFLNIFLNASSRAKQKEATSLVAAYIKAAQAYSIENGEKVKYAHQLGEYIKISGCLKNDPLYCRYATPFFFSNRKGIDTWNSPSGNYKIKIEGGESTVQIRAMPAGDISKSGYAVTGCFNLINGESVVMEHVKKGIYIPKLEC